MNALTLSSCLAVVCLALPAFAQTDLGYRRPLTLAPADASSGGAENDEKAQSAELAKKLSNPVANLISVPIQMNWDFGIGPANATRMTINVQPVIPVTLNEDWNVITRTILPIINAESPVKRGDDKFGLGDTTQSFFLSPKEPTGGGWIWGAGPAFLWPTSTDDALGTGKVGAGPTAVLLKQEHGWTYGVLANHLWSFAGQGNTADVNATFLQPFLAFTTEKFTTFTLNTESTYDWENEQWTVPLNLQVSQLVKIGKLPISFAVGGRYYAEGPSGGPEWGMRFVIQFLLPK